MTHHRSTIARARARRALRWLPVAAACLAATAHAADTLWTGAGSEPYWDIGANWTAGGPANASTNAWLSGYHTAIRSGDWLADSIQGQGSLAVTGGTLTLNGTYDSNIGALVLQGGAVQGPGKLVAGVLDWQGGTLGSGGSPGSNLGVRVEASAALISGNGALNESSTLTLKGPAWWKPGASTITANANSHLQVAAGGWVYDDASTAEHRLAGIAHRLTNDGAYVKVGSYATRLEVDHFTNNGYLVVQGGKLALGVGLPGGTWKNSGLIHVSGGGELELWPYRTRLEAGGKVQVADGKVTVNATELVSSADWEVGKDGVLRLGVSSGYAGVPKGDVAITGGSLHNEGRTVLAGAADFHVEQGYLSGGGTLELTDDAQLEWDGLFSLEGDLEITSHFDEFGYQYAGSIQLDIDAAGNFDSLSVAGTVLLDDAWISVEYGEDGPKLGTYRILTAEGGVTGSFFGVAGLYPYDPDWQPSNFDYFYQLVYGADYVDLKILSRDDLPGLGGLGGVTPVPEPQALGLMLLGVALLAAAARRRA